MLGYVFIAPQQKSNPTYNLIQCLLYTYAYRNSGNPQAEYPNIYLSAL
jgi:hypothetical protein